ncbi:MAG: FKBP-type peptidyl-prolyl cis-trans isomerase [Prevotellaceae bacterium]|nr:FKBP-type peptidyl-prolyl cis-trans isomerase [Candidatus Faecinaster equi]
MKKLMLVAIVAVIALGSCNNKPSANLKDDVDTLSYEFGMANSRGLTQYLSERLGVDTTYMDEFYKGFMDGANAGEDKKKAAYFAGIQIGQQVGTQMFKGLNYQIYGNDSTQEASLRNLIAGFIAGVSGEDQALDMDFVINDIQKRLQAANAKAMEKTYGDNKAKSDKFIAAKAKEEGVQKLTDGVYYKVIKEGTGATPADTSYALVSYEGKTMEGKVFDSSYKNNDGKPVEIRVSQMIPGWIDVLTHMKEGAIWQIYLAPEKAYGAREAGPDIKPFTALEFKVELAKVGRADFK